MEIIHRSMSNISRARAFQILRQRGVIRAELTYSGGDDEGSVNDIQLIKPIESMIESTLGYNLSLPLAPDGCRQGEGAAAEDVELARILEWPIHDRFGSWSGDYSAYGTLVWTVEGETVVMDVSETAWDDSREVY